MTTWTYLILLIVVVVHATQEKETCKCQNGGVCGLNDRCICLPNFVGDHCQISARPIGQQTVETILFGSYSLFYFEPSESNFFKLNFTICMINNPGKSDTLFFIETEKNNGSLRSIPSLFQTARLVLGQNGCVNFTTQYISVKRKQDDSFRRIVIGMKPMFVNESNSYLNIYRSDERMLSDEVNQMDFTSQISHFQQVNITMTYDVYIHNSYYGSYVVILAASSLIIVLLMFVSYLKKKSTERDTENTVTTEDLHLEYEYQPNPERIQRQKKNNLTIIEVFMPITLYGYGSKYFVSDILGTTTQESINYPEHDTCSICLVQFCSDEEIRTTPCKHKYHRDCIDEWCQSKLTCPICRHPLDFSKEISRIYYHYLRGDLHRCRLLPN